MAEFRDWRAPFKLARERLIDARRNGVSAVPFSQDLPPQEFFQQVKDGLQRSERIAEFNDTTPSEGQTRSPSGVETPHGRMRKISEMRGGGVVFGSQPGTKAFYEEKGLQAPEPYIERIDDFGEGGGGNRGGIKSTILSGKTGEELKDQQSARRRMGQGAVRRHARALAASEPAIESELP